MFVALMFVLAVYLLYKCVTYTHAWRKLNEQIDNETDAEWWDRQW